MSDRPTADLVMLIVTGVVALSILFTGAGIFVLAVVKDTDLSTALSSFGNVIGLMVGAVLGYLAGKGRSATSAER